MKFLNNTVSVLTALALTAGTAHAATIYTFSNSVGTQPSNVGTITITQVDSTTVDVLVDLLDGYGFVNTGGPHTPFAFNLAGTESGVSATFLQPSGGVFSFGLLSLDLAGGDNTPYGSYGVAIDSSAGNGSVNAYMGDLEFNLVRTSGLSIDDFVMNGVNGYFFSADLTDGTNTGAQAWSELSSSTGGASTGGASTGGASTGGASTGGTVPEPNTLTLLGLGLLALGFRSRQARKLHR